MLRDIIDNLAQIIIVLLTIYLTALFLAIIFNCSYQSIQKPTNENKLELYPTDTIKAFLPIEKGINWKDKIDRIYDLNLYDVIKYKPYGKDKKYDYYEIWLLYKYH